MFTSESFCRRMWNMETKAMPKNTTQERLPRLFGIE